MTYVILLMMVSPAGEHWYTHESYPSIELCDRAMMELAPELPLEWNAWCAEVDQPYEFPEPTNQTRPKSRSD